MKGNGDRNYRHPQFMFSIFLLSMKSGLTKEKPPSSKKHQQPTKQISAKNGVSVSTFN